MSGKEQDAKERFLKKHGTKSPEDIKRSMINAEEAKKKYTHDCTALEQNLKKFAEITDPIINPATDEPLCWVRRPTKEEFEKMIPPELIKYKNSLESVPKDVANKYEDSVYEMMAQLITEPKKNANWWKMHTPIVFLVLFQNHIANIYEQLGIDIEGF